MDSLESIKKPVKLSFWVHVGLTFYSVQTLTRLTLVVFSRPKPSLLQIFLEGFLWDTITLSVFFIPLVLMSFLPSFRFFDRFFGRKFEIVMSYLIAMFLVSIASAEIFFWMEFRSRFNFIAVDYLVYTNEVLTNLKESFPMPLIGSIVVVVAILVNFLAKVVHTFLSNRYFFNRQGLFTRFILLFFPFLCILGVAPWLENYETSFMDQQLARNGMYEFTRALRSNEIEYVDFYKTIEKSRARNLVKSKKTSLEPLGIIMNNNKPNVVLIVVESLGAKFIKSLGGQGDTTPFLNGFEDKSIFFSNFYATGTRTVRGLEAINLSIPPTPGYAVVKRPQHRGLYSMGNTFSANGYDSIFLYGGNGFFDNMNSFFDGNGFRVVDISDFHSSEITFKNAWGVCDEDLFNKAIKFINGRSNVTGKPFLLSLLTTSNHRPFTYPDGKIDIPSGESRSGAVKYTDYAIGKFLTSVHKEPWFQKTVFVIVADHSTEGRGQFNLEMSDFHIPLWIYSPLFTPQRISRIGSQVDLLPTLIHLLNLKDSSPFFGQSLLNHFWKENRAFIGNYQHVGYFKDNILTTLGPNKKINSYAVDFNFRKQIPIKNSPYEEETIGYYQLTSEMLKNGEFLIKH